MAKSTSPFMILGIHCSLCSFVATRRRVGTTEVMVRVRGGPPQRRSSVMKIICSMEDNPLPPYSLGQKMLNQPSSPSFFIKALE